VVLLDEPSHGRQDRCQIAFPLTSLSLCSSGGLNSRPSAGGEAVEFIEAAGVGVVGILSAVVQLPNRRSRSGLLEDVADRLFLEVEPFCRPVDRRADAAARMIASGEGTRAGRPNRPDRRRHARTGAPSAGARESMFGVLRLVAVTAQIAPALIVGQED